MTLQGGMTEELQSPPSAWPHRRLVKTAAEKDRGDGLVGRRDQNNPRGTHGSLNVPQCSLFFTSHCLTEPIRSDRWTSSTSLQLQGEDKWVGVGGSSLNGSWRISFSFLFSKISTRKRWTVIGRPSAGGDDDGGDILWKPRISRRDQTGRAGRRLFQSVRYWVCRWTFTESVYKVDESSLTKLNSLFTLRVF